MEERPHRIVIGQHVTDEKKRLARTMRREMTPAKDVLWQHLRGGKQGVYFRRQQNIAGFIADFYCHEAALVVEADGGVHDPAYDAERDRMLGGLGIAVIRFRNRQVLESIEWVLEEIGKHLPRHTPNKT